MEQSHKMKTTSAVIAIILVLAVAYVLFANYRSDQGGLSLFGDKNGTSKAVVEHTPAVNGVLPEPAGLPTGLPLETENITESVTTSYPDQGATQLSVSYLSSKTVAQKYQEYKDYMTQAGYELSEGDSSAPVRALFGTNVDADLSVVISSQGAETLVQLAYLLKSTN